MTQRNMSAVVVTCIHRCVDFYEAVKNSPGDHCILSDSHTVITTSMLSPAAAHVTSFSLLTIHEPAFTSDPSSFPTGGGAQDGPN